MLWTVPNILTILRLLAAPGVAVMFLYFHRPYADWCALILFMGAAITDWFDGYLARTWKQETKLGAMLDPIADKAMVGTAMICLSILDRMPWWITIVILAREIGITVFRLMTINRGVIAANKGGKIKATMQNFGVGFYVLPLSPSLYWFRDGFMYIAVALTIVTGAYYVKSAFTKS